MKNYSLSGTTITFSIGSYCNDDCTSDQATCNDDWNDAKTMTATLTGNTFVADDIDVSEDKCRKLTFTKQ